MRKLFFTLLTLLSVCAHSQTTGFADILPSEGRNKLFHDYLITQVDTLAKLRHEAVNQALQSTDNLMARKKQLRENYVMLLGDLPQKSALNAEVVDSHTSTEGCTIENLHFQSRPNHHVTANFYIPNSGEGPYPTVLIACGHYPVAKSYLDYQRLAISFTKHGMAALIVDPIGQGERYQITNESNALVFRGGSGTTELSLLDVGAVLTGNSTVAFELWDNHRAVDYLYSRTDVVDTAKIGCIGHSGGGAQATYLLAYDQRLKAGVVSNFIMNEPTLYKTIGPQTGSQNLSYEGAYSIDHPDYISMFAPKPFLIIGTTVDFFDINGTYATYDETQKVYDTLGVSEKVSLLVTTDKHDLTTVKREAAVRWFNRWFNDDNDTIMEGTLIPSVANDLLVTPRGQVMMDFDNEVNVTDLTIERADTLGSYRDNFWSANDKATCIDKVKELIQLEEYETVSVADSGTITRSNYSIQRLVINSAEQVPVTGLLYVPNNITGKVPAVVYVDGRGKKETAAEYGAIENNYVDSGKIVLAIDVRGFGETKDNPDKNESKHRNNEHRNAVISLYVGKTLIGQRVEDIMKAMDVLHARTDVDTSSIILVGVDRAGPVAQHAALLDDRIDELRLYKSITTWGDVVADPLAINNMTHEVPGALLYYDLPHLTEAFAPKPITYGNDYLAEKVVKVASTKPQQFELYPNPARDQIIMNYNLAEAALMVVNIYDLQGRLLKNPLTSKQLAGEQAVIINTNDLKEGTYLLQLVKNNTSGSTQKLTILP